MIKIVLDTPLRRGDSIINELVIETPILAGHLLRATKLAESSRDQTAMELFAESVTGLQSGELGRLTIEDLCKVLEAIGPFMASFNRLNMKGPS